VGRVTLDRLMGAVMRATSVDEEIIRRSARGVTNPSRLIAITLAVELRVGPVLDLVGYFRLGTAASLRNVARRGRIASATESSVVDLRQRVMAELFAADLLRGA